MIGVEQYTLRYRRLHPRIVDFLQPYFDGLDLKEEVWVNAKHGRTSLLRTSIWVLCSTIVVMRGKLNAEGGIDLSRWQDMAVMAHECYHVKQWRSLPKWKSLWMLLVGLTKKRWHDGPWEIEAIAFQKEVTPSIRKRHAELELEVFKRLR